MTQSSSNINIQLPTIRKDIILMSPGIWNNYEYSSEEIKRAFEMTDWSRASNLFLDHPDKPNNAAGDWIGRVLNPRFVSGEILGDLEMWDTNTIIKTELARAKFGVSPRVISNTPESLLIKSGKFTDFVFDNFAVVSKPAIDKSYINMNKKENVISQVLYKTEKTETKELNEQVELSEQEKEFNRIIDKIRKEEELTDEEEEHMKKKIKKKNEITSDEMRKMMKKEHPDWSEEEIEEKIKMKSYSKEKEKLKGGNEKMSETETTVSATQTEQKELSFEELSIEELNAILDKVQKVIASKTPKVQEMAKQDLTASNELEAMRKQIQELSAKLNKPAPKTVRFSGGNIRAQLTAPGHSEGVRELAEMLRAEFK